MKINNIQAIVDDAFSMPCVDYAFGMSWQKQHALPDALKWADYRRFPGTGSKTAQTMRQISNLKYILDHDWHDRIVKEHVTKQH
jgi:hypothetical protein